MVEAENTLRSQRITLCGQTFPVRTDLSAEAMDELVRQAQERLDRLGVRPPLDDPQRLLLSFLVVCGELQESQKKVEELKEIAQKAETFSEKLAQLLEISDIH